MGRLGHVILHEKREGRKKGKKIGRNVDFSGPLGGPVCLAGWSPGLNHWLATSYGVGFQSTAA